MDILDRYKKYREEAEQCRRRADMAEGSLRQLRKQLAEEFGCRDEHEAQRLLHELEQQLAELEQSFQKEFAQFEEQWHQLTGSAHDHNLPTAHQ